ncbi:MAG: AMP-dependent synthetase/ligase [Bacteroidales bacterium]
MQITRTFDILEYQRKNYSREDSVAGKVDNEWVKYSTDEFIKNSEAVAMALIKVGIAKGDVVASISANKAEWNFIDMGLAMIGAVHLPVYPTISETDTSHILNHAEPKLLFVGDSKLYEKLKSLASEVSSIREIYSISPVEGIGDWKSLVSSIKEDEKGRLKQELEQRQEQIAPSDLVTLIYTSGTTGTPKGVMLTHENIMFNVQGFCEHHPCNKAHKAVSFLPLCHIYERTINYHYMFKGIGVYYIANLGEIVGDIKTVKPDIFCSVPRVLERIYDGIINKGYALSGMKKTIFFWALSLADEYEHFQKGSLWYILRRWVADKLVFSKWRAGLTGKRLIVVSGGAAIQPRIARALGVAGIFCIEGYGMTETAPVIAANNPMKKLAKVGTVGPPLPGIEVKIADDGEILTRGKCVMKGYYKDPEATASVIDEDGWLHTGDIGCFENEMYLKITDRKKEMFKLSGGKYIAPQVFENKLKESFFIEQAMIIGAEEKFASAIISPNLEYLRAWCKKRKLTFKNDHELIELPEVQTVIQNEVAKVNETLAPFEQLRKVRIVPDTWNLLSGELSPTLKLRRNYISHKYSDIIKTIYSHQSS